MLYNPKQFAALLVSVKSRMLDLIESHGHEREARGLPVEVSLPVWLPLPVLVVPLL